MGLPWVDATREPSPLRAPWPLPAARATDIPPHRTLERSVCLCLSF